MKRVLAILFFVPFVMALAPPCHAAGNGEVTVSLIMPDSPTRMSISATMCLSPSCSHPPCYLQDRDEISDDVIITKP